MTKIIFSSLMNVSVMGVQLFDQIDLSKIL